MVVATKQAVAEAAPAAPAKKKRRAAASAADKGPGKRGQGLSVAMRDFPLYRGYMAGQVEA